MFDSRAPTKDVAAIIVWNPATKRFRLLPKAVPALKNHHLYQPLLGFVYLDDISDYKLVKILPGKADVAFQAQVFTGSTNSWRDVECYSSGEGYRRYVHGKTHLHFLACAGFSCYEFWVMSEESNNKIEGTQM